MQALVFLLAATAAGGDHGQGGYEYVSQLQQTAADGGEMPDATKHRRGIDRQAATGRRPAASMTMPPRFAVRQAAYEEDRSSDIRQAQYSDQSTWPTGTSAANAAASGDGSGGNRQFKSAATGSGLLADTREEADSRSYIPPGGADLEAPNRYQPTIDRGTVATLPNQSSVANQSVASSQGAVPDQPSVPHQDALPQITMTPPASNRTATPQRTYQQPRMNQASAPADTTAYGDAGYSATQTPTPNTVVTPPPDRTNKPVATVASALQSPVVNHAVANQYNTESNDVVVPQRSGNLGLTMMTLFASLGLNLYLGWIAWDTYNRYQDMVADLRSPAPRRDRYDRDGDAGRGVSTAFEDRRVAESATY